MKTTLFALPALLITTGLAHAADPNVTVYGVMDAGVEYLTKANVAKDHLFRVASGAMNTSRLGFRGAEDLGGGMKAIFQLEGGIKLNTGQSDGDLFGRQANVGLEGSFGRLVVGRSYSTTYDFMLPFDPMGYSGNYSWVISGNATPPSGTTARKDGMLGGTSNLLKYQIESSGLKFGATYGLGNVAASSKDSARYALGAAYTKGPVAVAGTWDQTNGTSNAAGAYDKAVSHHLTGSYQTGPVKLFLGYRHYKKSLASQAPALKSATYWSGVSYQLAPGSTLVGAVYSQNVKNVAAGADADPRMFVLRYKYALSKRTDLYATTARVSGKNNKPVSLSRDDIGFGTSQAGLTLGLQHRF